MEITTDAMYELPAVLLLSTGLNLVWRNRSEGKKTTVPELKAELWSLGSLLEETRPRGMRETLRQAA